MTFEKIDKFIEWSKDYCKLCKLCVEMCPIKNLEITGNNLVSKNKCTGCGLCELHCPDAAIIIKK